MAKLSAGSIFPDYTVTTQFEEATTISRIAGGKPLMLVVLRYIGCPSCRYDVHMLQINHEQFKKKGVSVAVVMQSTPESIRAALQDEPLSFPIICDPEYKLYNDLEIKPAGSREEMLGSEETLQKFRKKREAIRELGYTHGEYEGIEEQLPAFFYMNEKLEVITAHYAEGIGDMPTAEEMLAM
ncbi:MAG: redoxin domain-containing protein [Clostridia bacterium]|nr:redoxin domain-containing protein [Clostridia bacterium]